MPTSLTYILRLDKSFLSFGTCCGDWYGQRANEKASDLRHPPSSNPDSFSEPFCARQTEPKWLCSSPLCSASRNDCIPQSVTANCAGARDTSCPAPARRAAVQPISEGLQEKKTLVEAQTDVESFTCVATHRSLGCRILTAFPFGVLRLNAVAGDRWPPIVLHLSFSLGPTHPRRNTLPVETLPTFAQTSLMFVLATNTKICTRGSSNQAHAL